MRDVESIRAADRTAVATWRASLARILRGERSRAVALGPYARPGTVPNDLRRDIAYRIVGSPWYRRPLAKRSDVRRMLASLAP